MEFDYCIGNPPYQEETESDSTRMPPVYHLFMDETYKIGNVVELITPARFLFNAGYTPKSWNEKMLNSCHFKVLDYFQKSEEVFPNTDIKGGIAVSLKNESIQFEPVKIFTVFKELNSVLNKVSQKHELSLNTIMYPALSYKLSPTMKKEHPDSLDRLRTSAFVKLKEIFYEDKPNDGHEYIQLLGLLGRDRVYRWIDRRYLLYPDNFDNYKVILPESNGSGALGEVLSTPLIGQPLIGHTQTFISIGNFTNKKEAEHLMKYIKSKFCRSLLGVLKITQHNPPATWKYVPMQDFTETSDIDWTQSISDVDKQLYKKYGLSEEEINFIETHVKEME